MIANLGVPLVPIGATGMPHRLNRVVVRIEEMSAALDPRRLNEIQSFSYVLAFVNTSAIERRNACRRHRKATVLSLIHI